MYKKLKQHYLKITLRLQNNSKLPKKRTQTGRKADVLQGGGGSARALRPQARDLPIDLHPPLLSRY